MLVLLLCARSLFNNQTKMLYDRFKFSSADHSHSEPYETVGQCVTVLSEYAFFKVRQYTVYLCSHLFEKTF